jgi:hypothetical protein
MVEGTEDTSRWYVERDLTSAGDGVRGKLEDMAGATGLFSTYNGKTGEEDTVYDGEEKVYMRAR